MLQVQTTLYMAKLPSADVCESEGMPFIEELLPVLTACLETIRLVRAEAERLLHPGPGGEPTDPVDPL